MIVEVIGCTGAGKSTLTGALREHRIGGLEAISMPEVALGRTLSRHISNPTALNLAQDARALPGLVAAGPRLRPFLSFAMSTLLREASGVHRANGLRSICRRTGMLQLARRRCGGKIVLADEGTVLLAFMLAHEGRPAAAQSDDVERFAALVPLPDLIVHARAPVDVLVHRARSRGDRGRQLGGLDDVALERLIRNTVDVFDRLVTIPRIAGRTLAVDTERAADATELARRIGERLTASASDVRAAALPGATGLGAA
jgi:hypothetical protein